MAPRSIFDESEAEWAKHLHSATLARMSLSERLYQVPLAFSLWFEFLNNIASF